MKQTSSFYIPALRYHWLTRFYDTVVRLTTRENTFKPALIEQAGIQDSHRVLDLGCGTATLALMVKRRHPTAEVVGVDADLEALELARHKAQAGALMVELDQGFASDLPYPDASFDRVLSSLFFHHLTDKLKDEAMLEVGRVLRPGGEFHIADWGKPTSSAMRCAFLGVQLLDGFATTRNSVKGLLPDLLSLAGFKRVEVTRNYSTLFGTLALYRACKPSGVM
jgi:ubiquinone/menaquinone biosynthesis C-methylase UbiE